MKTKPQHLRAGGNLARIKAAGALAPLAVLSMGWTTVLVAPSTPAVVAAPAPAVPQVVVPDVPAELPAPASSTRPAPAARGGALLGVRTVSASSARDIPAAAFSAYQRAAAVMEAADSACHLPWELLAAIGRVESDHGRFGNSHLNAEGRATPRIIGIPLNGRRNTAAISDTDAGLLDGDQIWDRAVGPMQFIPSTWSVVGVDSDGDGRRDPQDIDDAALGAGVYLCAGDNDLRTGPGRAEALMRYNHDIKYVRLVLSIFSAYRAQDWTPTFTVTTVARFDTALALNALAATAVFQSGHRAANDPVDAGDGTGPAGPGAAGGTATPAEPTETPDPTPTVDPTPTPTPEPTPDPTPTPEPTPDPTPEPTPDPTPEPTPDPTPTPEPTTEPTPTPEPTPDPTTEPDPTPEPTSEATAPAEIEATTVPSEPAP